MDENLSEEQLSFIRVLNLQRDYLYITDIVNS